MRVLGSGRRFLTLVAEAEVCRGDSFFTWLLSNGALPAFSQAA